MKFGELFEYHKIPEWYNMYLNYELLRQKIDDFNENAPVKLPGYYFLCKDSEIKKLELQFDILDKVENKPDENYKIFNHEANIELMNIESVDLNLL